MSKRKSNKYRFTSLNTDVAGAWKLQGRKSSFRKNPSFIIGFIYDGTFGRSNRIIRGMLLKIENEVAYLLTKEKKEVKVLKNTLKIVC